MVPSFCRLQLPQPSYRPIKTLQVFLQNTFFALSFTMAFYWKFTICHYAGFSQIGSHILTFRHTTATVMKFLSNYYYGINHWMGEYDNNTKCWTLKSLSRLLTIHTIWAALTFPWWWKEVLVCVWICKIDRCLSSGGKSEHSRSWLS